MHGKEGADLRTEIERLEARAQCSTSMSPRLELMQLHVHFSHEKHTRR